MKPFSLIILCILLSSLNSYAVSNENGSTTKAYSRRVEIRAVWMDRNSIPKTEQGMRELIRSYARAGFNMVLPEVIYYGRSAYPSKYLEEQNLWNGLDMLRIVIDESHKVGIEVHPWVSAFRTGNASDHGGILKKHPEWAAVDRNGRALSANNGYWLCPSIPAVRELLKNALVELAQKYDIDGIHLDYIRFEEEYPEPYCYNESCRSKFKAAYGIDPRNIEPFTKPSLDWQLWRENLIDTFVAEVCSELRKVRPGIVVSAAVGSSPDESRIHLLQDWGHWADNKWVDFLCPMDYTSDVSYFQRVVDAANKRVSDHALLAPGVGLFATSETRPILDQIDITRSSVVEGATLFASAYLDDQKLKALAEGPFRNHADLPFRMPACGVQQLLTSAHQSLAKSVTVDQLSNSHTDLATAANLLDFWVYRAQSIQYVPPTALPIFIPEKVQPLPTATIPAAASAPKIDGLLDDPIWQKASVLHIARTAQGADASQPTDVFLAYDKENIYIAFRCFDPNPERIKATVTLHDGPVFADDSIEVFLSPDGNTYYHFAANGLGTTFEQKVYDTSWNCEWKAASGRESGAWTEEMAIPFKSLGIKGPSAGCLWRGNFCRNRIVDSKTEADCWSETYGSYHTPIRFGMLDFGEDK